jgi:hypothetical protein
MSEAKIAEVEPLGEISKFNSEQFARQIEFFKMGIHLVDWEYAEKMIPELRNLASRQNTMIIFNPGFPMKKIEALEAQAEALEKFVEGVKLLKKVDRLKREAEKEGNAFKEIFF